MLVQLHCLLNILKTDRRGVTALEYAIMGTFIAVAIVVAVTGVGKNLSNAFANISNKVP